MRSLFPLRTLFVLLLATPVAPAATLYWDADGSTTAATGGTGGWNTANTWRDGSSTGTLGSWVASSDAVLEGTAGTVTLDAAIAAGGVTVSTSGYTVTTSAGARNLTATSLSLSSGVGFTLAQSANVNLVHEIGSISGGTGASLTLSGTVSSANRFRVDVTGGVSVPTTITSSSDGPIGYAGTSTSAAINGVISNSSSSPTLLGAVNTGNVLNVNAAVTGSAGVFFGINGSSSGSTPFGAGTVFLNSSTSYTGATTVRMNNAGIVDAKVDGALGSTSAVNVVNGTLLLSGGSGVTNRVNNSAPVTLGASATTTATIKASGAVTETFGALTLAGAGTRIIDFGTTSAVLTFASIASSSTGLALQIWNWSGLLTGGGTDQLIATGGFGSNINLSNINFYSGAGTGFLGTAQWVSGTTGELVPVPEPGALAALAALAAACGWRERRTRPRAG